MILGLFGAMVLVGADGVDGGVGAVSGDGGVGAVVVVAAVCCWC